MAGRPRIGVTLDVDDGAQRYEIKQAYVEAVLAAGAVPVLLPPAERVAASYLAMIDGLVVTGGAFDVPPELYGEPRREVCGPIKASRTAFEKELLEAVLASSLPVLGICGGMQLMNVVRGGTLHQDLADAGLNGHEQPPPKDVPTHAIQVPAGTLLWRLIGLGVPEHRVNSTHHQAVKTAGTGVLVAATAPDGVIEAIECNGSTFCLGVQWHPENFWRTGEFRELFEGFIAACSRRL